MKREEEPKKDGRKEKREKGKKEREKRKERERERKKWQSIAVFFSLSRIIGIKMNKVRSVCLKAVHHIFLLAFSLSLFSIPSLYKYIFLLSSFLSHSTLFLFLSISRFTVKKKQKKERPKSGMQTILDIKKEKER